MTDVKSRTEEYLGPLAEALVRFDFLRKSILVDLFLSLEKNESRRDKMEGKYEVAIFLLSREKLFWEICLRRSRVS